MSRHRLLLLTASLVVTGAALAAGWLLWRTPEPPNVDLAGAEPALADAIDAARADVRAAPRSAAAWGKLGMVLRAHDFGTEANACFAQAQRLDPDDPRWPYLRALTLALADRDAAIPLLERAAERSGRNTAPRLRLAEVLLLQGRADDAEHQWRAVLAAEPGNPRAHLGLARLAHRRGAGRAAMGHLQHAVQSPLTRQAALTLRAQVKQQLGLSEEARADARLAAQGPEDPSWPDPFVEEVERLRVGAAARIELAVRLERQGRGAEAVALLEQTARDNPESGAADLALGEMLVRLGQPARAEAALRRATARTPDSAEAHFQLGNALFLQDRPQAAADAFRAAIRIQPGHALAHYNLGHCMLKLDDRPGATAAFRGALRHRPDHAAAHTNLADLLARDGNDAEAVAHLEAAVRLAPGDERARKLLAEVRARRPARAP